MSPLFNVAPSFMLTYLKKNWFMLGLVGVALLVLADIHEVTVGYGEWLKQHRGPDFVIVLIFFLSGLALDLGKITDGLRDVKGTVLALGLIFIVAPVLALPFPLIPIEPGIIIGIFLVAAMPTTLSSGVVMTGSSGGNMAHALFITILANAIAVFTIPLILSILLQFADEARVVTIDQIPIMMKIATLVLLPLTIGIVVRYKVTSLIRPLLGYTTICNQLGILTIVWMAMCSGRTTIVDNLSSLGPVLLSVFVFHLLLVLTALLLTRLFRIPKGKRESVIFMGGQKTLPLSVIIQVTVFPDFGLALVVCVSHHIVHLIMDAFLVRHLKENMS